MTLEPINYTTGAVYSGKNIERLMTAAAIRGYARPQWLTYKQAQSVGLQVRKGEKGVKIEKVGQGQCKKTGKKTRFLRAYTVFNVEQCDRVTEEAAA